MKRVFIGLVIFCVLCVICALSAVKAVNFSDELLEKINMVEEFFGDLPERSAQIAREMIESWENFEEKSLLVGNFEQAAEISASLAEILAYARENDDEVFAACGRAAAQIKQFRGTNIPTVWKIL